MTDSRFRLPTNSQGAVGIITVMLVLGFMMSISVSYVLMVQTEFKVGDAIDNHARAKDAALAGVHFALARLQATSTTYLVANNDAELSTRLYFARSAQSTDKNQRFSGLTPTNFTNVASSQWMFPVSSLDLGAADEAAEASVFKVTSYPATASGILDHSKYYVKSQGMYRVIDSADLSVLATFSAQILARFNIATPTRSVHIESYRYMEFERSDDTFDSFFTSRTTIYPP